MKTGSILQKFKIPEESLPDQDKNDSILIKIPDSRSAGLVLDCINAKICK